nr:unnamed protein product [Callosobruchus chinensis]
MPRTWKPSGLLPGGEIIIRIFVLYPEMAETTHYLCKESQHRPVILDIGLFIPRTNWQGFADHLDKYIDFIPTEPKYYHGFVGAVVAAAKKHIPRGYRREYIPEWNKHCKQLYNE